MKRPLLLLMLVAVAALAALSLTYARVPTGSSFDSPEQMQGIAIVGRNGLPVSPSILQILDNHREFSDFRRAVERSGLSSTLDSKGPFTVFVPTDEAFDRLPASQEEDLLQNSSSAKDMVQNQMAHGFLVYGATGTGMETMDLARVGYIVTADGSRIPVTVTRSEVRVGKSRLLKANIKASNGIIHVVDQVILPDEQK